MINKNNIIVGVSIIVMGVVLIRSNSNNWIISSIALTKRIGSILIMIVYKTTKK